MAWQSKKNWIANILHILIRKNLSWLLDWIIFTCTSRLTFPCILVPRVDRAWLTIIHISPNTTVGLIGTLTAPSDTVYSLIFSYSVDVERTTWEPTLISIRGLQPVLYRTKQAQQLDFSSNVITRMLIDNKLFSLKTTVASAFIWFICSNYWYKPIMF